MASNSKLLVIFTTCTKLGKWRISTYPETFQISNVMDGLTYYLTISNYPEFERSTEKGVYEHVRAVAEHRTGLRDWDESGIRVSDYVKDWNLRLDKKFQINLVAEYLRIEADASMRQMVDYFERKYGYMIDRIILKDLLQELVITRQVDKLPSMYMAPAEMKSLEPLAKEWLKERET